MRFVLTAAFTLCKMAYLPEILEFFFRNMAENIEKAKEREKNEWGEKKKKRKKLVWIFSHFLFKILKNHLFKLPILHPLMRVVSKKKWPSPPPDVFN